MSSMRWLATAVALVACVASQADPVHPDRPNRWQEVFATPGAHVTGAAFGNSELFVTDRQLDKVRVVDLATGETVRDLPIPGYIPVGLAHDGTDLWVADHKGKRLHRISTVDGTSIASIPGPATRTTGLTWDGTALWAADRIADEVYRVDPRDGNVTLTLQAGGEHAWGLAWDGESLLSTDYQSDKIYLLTPASLPPYGLLEDRREEIAYHHEARVYGPEPLLEGVLSLAVPRNRPGLEIEGSIAFEPAPAEVVKDQWGQDIARFRFTDVAAPGHVGAVMRVRAHTWTLRYYIFPEKVGDLDDIPYGVRKAYLADGDKYRIDDPVIREVVDDVVGDEANAYAVMRALYDHVLANMEYELAGGWNVAPAVLERGSGSCSEYTFVFIALCRAAGLPARYVGSIVQRYDDAAVDEGFHRWAEVYLPPYGWVPVDPSRGDKGTPARQAASIGQLGNGLMVTTESGGDSDDLGWTYNSASRFTTRGPVKVVEETYADWETIDETE